MKFSFFHLMPYTHLDLESHDWPFPNRYFDPAKASALYKTYVESMIHAEGCGFVANREMLPYYGTTLDTDEELLARLPSIDKLTLILHGTADRMIPKESVQLLKGRLPRSYLVYVWDAAHAIEVDQPERMLVVLGSFLERSEGFMVNWGTLAVNPG